MRASSPSPHTKRRGSGRGGRLGWEPLSPALSPLVPRRERGTGRGGRLGWEPLSPALSPLVPRRERGTGRGPGEGEVPVTTAQRRPLPFQGTPLPAAQGEVFGRAVYPTVS